MPVNRYERLTRYLHLSDRANEPQHQDGYDKLYKIRPIITMTQESFKEYYKPGKHQTTDEAMVVYKGRLSYVQYLPAKPIKRGIKLWMRCDSESAYLHEYDVYLGKRQNSQYGLAYDVVTKLCHTLSGHNHHVYCDNYFTSIPLFKELLHMKIYASGTVRKNKKGLPDTVKRKPKMVQGEYKEYQDENTNLVATVWNDSRPVRVLSTNARPDISYPIERRVRNEVVHIDQPENIFMYNKYINVVDKHDQLRMKYNIGQFSVKAWKYLLWFFINASIVNAYILYAQTSTQRTKKTYTHFHFDVAHGLIAGFTSRKRQSNVLQHVRPEAITNDLTHEHVHLGVKSKRCKWHLMQKRPRRETVYGCKICNVHLCKDGCHLAYHSQ